MERAMELRFYCFVNFYLSSIQQGIQAGHCAVELFRRHHSHQLVQEWAMIDKTFIVLNGGDAGGIEIAKQIIIDSDYPCATFEETPEALGGITTAVGVVLPESIFNARLNNGDTYESVVGNDTYTYLPGMKLYPLVRLLQRSQLAR